MSLITLFLATAIIFLVADALMLRAVIQPVFARHLGDALLWGINRFKINARNLRNPRHHDDIQTEKKEGVSNASTYNQL